MRQTIPQQTYIGAAVENGKVLQQLRLAFAPIKPMQPRQPGGTSASRWKFSSTNRNAIPSRVTIM
ncbi:MAG: hypothetical protein B7Z37_10585 [Verrucomicrobia bacterium 12-59-8]|nr:MAG: hypothetical protein B7Z37_10585 [Verrucomicrobia bacterium 12-59-8]